MSHADTAAAAPPVAPRTVRNRLRSIGRASVVTHGAVARDVALHVAVDAPTHLKRGDLVHLRHAIHLAMARAAALRPQNLDVALVREAHEAREGMHARPHGRLLVGPRVAQTDRVVPRPERRSTVRSRHRPRPSHSSSSSRALDGEWYRSVL